MDLGSARRTNLAEQLVRIAELRTKLGPNLFPYRVAARPDTRAYRCDEVLGVRPVLRAHRADPVLHDARHSPAPSSMKGCNCLLLHIDHQHRSAVRRTDPKHHPGKIRHQAIPLQQGLAVRGLELALERAIGLPDHLNDAAVNLPHIHQSKASVASLFAGRCTQESASVLRHQRRVILPGPSQIERISTIDGGDAARTGAESVSQPGILLPIFHPQDVNARNIITCNVFHHPKPSARYAFATRSRSSILNPTAHSKA